MEPVTEQGVLELLKTVYDPELGVNIVDLGLIYEIDIRNRHVEIRMTMTTPGCPMHNAIVGGVEQTLKSQANIHTVHVEVVWEPKWTPERMTEAAKEQLDYF